MAREKKLENHNLIEAIKELKTRILDLPSEDSNMNAEIHELIREMDGLLSSKIGRNFSDNEIRSQAKSLISQNFSKINTTKTTDAQPSQSLRKTFEKYFDSRLFGQEVAKRSLSSLVSRLGAGFVDGVVDGSFLFCGPTGTGKTESAIALSDFLERRLIRIDMGEFQESHTVSSLLGSPPGYSESQSTARLESIMGHSDEKKILLLDEMEKADVAIQKVFLSAMDKGSVTTRRGTRVDFKNTIIIITTNLAADEIMMYPEGFLAAGERERAIKDSLRQKLLPEFLGRVEKIVPFERLTKSSVRSICENHLSSIVDSRAAQEKLSLVSFSDMFIADLADLAANSEFGARSIKSLVRNLVEGPLADVMTDGNRRGEAFFFRLGAEGPKEGAKESVSTICDLDPVFVPSGGSCSKEVVIDIFAEETRKAYNLDSKKLTNIAPKVNRKTPAQIIALGQRGESLSQILSSEKYQSMMQAGTLGVKRVGVSQLSTILSSEGATRILPKIGAVYKIAALAKDDNGRLIVNKMQSIESKESIEFPDLDQEIYEPVFLDTKKKSSKKIAEEI